MRIRARTLFVVAAVFVALRVTSLVLAAPITIENHSLEELSRELAVGEQSNGAGGAGVPVATRFPFGGGGVSWANPVVVPGWRTRLLPFGELNTILAGVLRPPILGGQAFITGQDGDNVAAVQAAQMGQALSARLAANTRYRLDFLGGIGLFGTDYHLAVSLIAVDSPATFPLENEPGVTRLAITQGLVPPESSFGTMLPWSLEYTTPPVLPANLVGKYVGVHLWGSDGFPRVIYDEFRLDATELPEPGTGVLLGVLVGVGVLRRGRRLVVAVAN